MLKKITLIFLVLNLLLAGNILFKIYSDHIEKDCVPNKKIAIDIGKTICENMYPDLDYGNCKWECIFSEYDNVWLVFCRSDEGGLDGGFPQICISKNNARVISIGLA